MKYFLMVGVVNHSNYRFAVGHDSQRQAPGVQAVKKAAGAVNRVDYPQNGRFRQLRAALFAEKAVLRERVHNLLLNKLFDLLIGDAHHVLQIVTLMIDREAAALLIETKGQLGAGFCQFTGEEIAGVQRV
nr:Uncharacterised protein [Raoultella sp. NCTC 9187]